MNKFFIQLLVCFSFIQCVPAQVFQITTPEQISYLHSNSDPADKTGFFFNDLDIKRIKELQSKDSLIALGVRKTIHEANKILEEPLLEYSLDEAKLRVKAVHQFASQLPLLILSYQITKDTVYAARAWKQLALMVNYLDWGANRHFLDAGIGAFDVAFAINGLGGYINEEQTNLLADAVMKFVLIPGREQMQKNIWWSTANHNWNGICNGGIIMAALAVFQHNPVLCAEVISLAVNRLPTYIQHFSPDGQSEEGLMYWGYGLMYTTITFEALKRRLGTVFGLDTIAGFKKTGWFPVLMSGPVAALNIGDDPIKTEKAKTLFWFARHYQDKGLATLNYHNSITQKNITWQDLLYYDPALVEKKTNKSLEIPLANYTRGIEVASIRSSWNDDAAFISIHGGANNANHGHLDAGSFDIQSDGVVWAIGNLGRDDYTFPGYFSKTTKPDYLDAPEIQATAGRWHFYRLRAEGKNVLVINPDVRPDQNEKGVAQISSLQLKQGYQFYTADLSSCYSRDVLLYQRSIGMHTSNGLITVQDTVMCKQASTIWWSMHTGANIELGDNGKTAVLKHGNKQMKVYLRSPVNASFVVLSASYLPGQSFPLTKNSPNNGFKKLAIKISNAKEALFKIDFGNTAFIRDNSSVVLFNK